MKIYKLNDQVNIVDWQESVLSISTEYGAASASGTNRYVAPSASGTWTDNYIYQYNGATWDETVANEGQAVWVEDEDVLYVYSGASWVKFGSTVDHGNLLGLADDDHTQYTLADGTRQLSGDWHVGDYDITTSGNVSITATTAQLLLPQSNDPATPTLAFGDGNSGFYESEDDTIRIALNGVNYYTATIERFYASTGATLRHVGPGATIPSIVPLYTDLDTGIGHAADDQLSLIAGGVEGIRITENGGPIYITNMGGQVVHSVTCSGNYAPSILTSDYIIAMTNTDSARTVTISTEDEDTGSTDNPRIIIVKDESGGAAGHNITVSLESGGNIDGTATYVMNQNYQCISLYIDGTNAWIY